ncbi:hypothetical protein [Chelativorans intermedius]|uniref:Uncharacterized protein n=1 Tax=Chelativorans intermedius TaxID=515947 RepID=A0ABV6D337_9HYPH|nr:hypothetical protein [Chelativorans intermedius]MCT8998445.1 hypothetical protein [Chelativorans intermedius]
MHHPREDSIKRRLTDRAHLLLAVEKLLERGVPEEMIPVHLARAFYIDMDELNAVLAAMHAPTAEGTGRHSLRAAG